jgi:hypothetical protein
MDSLETLADTKEETFKKFSLAKTFEWQGTTYRIGDLVAAYRELVPRVAGLNFARHMTVFLRWLAVRSQEPTFREHVNGIPVADATQAHQRAVDAHTDWMDAKRKSAFTSTGRRFDLKGQPLAEDEAELARVREKEAVAKEKFEALREDYEAAMRQREYTTVWQRLDKESKAIMADWERMRPEYERQMRLRGSKVGPGVPLHRPLAAAPGFSAALPALTAVEAELARAWDEGTRGRQPLPPEVMALFDLLVHDTVLAAWEDQLLAPSLYFRLREVSTFGKTDLLAGEREARARLWAERDERRANRGVTESWVPGVTGSW